MNPQVKLPGICFVIPYFGKWPFWMPFFLASCRANPSIDWLLFSDCGPREDCPPNVRIVECTYEDYCARVSERLGIDFHPASPYKLCDLKPALGHVHEVELVGYDFWAFGDLDLVYGDLRGYFSVERLRTKDLLSTHMRRISGHCCLIRNTRDMRELFMQIADWKVQLSEERHVAMDEGAFSRLFIRYKNLPQGLARWLRMLNPRFRRAEFVEAYSTPDAKLPWVDGTRRFPAHWTWCNGVLKPVPHEARPFPYLHFMKWKSAAWASLSAEQLAAYPDLARQPGWQISARGFAPLDEPCEPVVPR